MRKSLDEIYTAVVNRAFEKGFTKHGEGVLDRRHEKYLRDIERYDSFLEVGSGEGRSSLYLAKKGRDVSCIDIENPSPELVDFLFKNEIRMNYICDDFLTYKFDRKFDCVFAAEVLEHITDWKLFLEKMITLANKCVVFTTPVERSFWDPGHVHFFSGSEFNYLVKYGYLEIQKLYTKEKDKALNQQCFYMRLLKPQGGNTNA